MLAAASLGDVLPPIAAAFEAERGVRVDISFASSVSLQRQIEQGAPADAFVSAASAPLDALQLAHRIVEGSRRDVARNTIVVVTRPQSDLPRDLPGLAGADVRLALGDVGVPVGEYARASLRQLGLWETIEPKVVPLANEPAVLQAVMRGVVEGGIVYGSSVRDGVEVVSELPASTHPPVRYPAAVLASSTRVELARAFVDFLVSPASQARFAAAGFLPPPAE